MHIAGRIASVFPNYIQIGSIELILYRRISTSFQQFESDIMPIHPHSILQHRISIAIRRIYYRAVPQKNFNILYFSMF